MKKFTFLLLATSVVFFFSACSSIQQWAPLNNADSTTRNPISGNAQNSDHNPSDEDKSGVFTSKAPSGDEKIEVSFYPDSPRMDELMYDIPTTAPEEISDSPFSQQQETGPGVAETGNGFKGQKQRAPIDESLELCQASQEFWQKGELENALEALDEAYELILKVDTYDNPKLTQQKDDLRFMISKRILEIYASRNIVVKGNHNAIPIIINQHVQSEIDLFTKGREKNFFIHSYKRSGLYRPMIVEELRKAGLPVELSWLPLIESGFKANALSRARALGLWQFIPSTGYKFGLTRDRYIDERLDFQKATLAAIDYLKELHQIFGDWTTVLAGYNCGEGRVLRVIRSQNVNYLDNFWDLYERLPRETARYVPRFLATLHIVNNLEKYGLDTIKPYPPLEFATIKISNKVHLKSIAEVTGVSEKSLKLLNPELRYGILPSKDYLLRVPKSQEKSFLANLDKIPEYSPPHRSYVYHRVRRGESISTIAKRYGAGIKDIAIANHLNRRYLIRAGQTLKIPLTGSSDNRTRRVSKIAPGQTTTHTVRAGDSLWIIARRYGTTVKNIQALNRLTTTNLYIGQKLKISGATIQDALASKKNLATYQVKRGDCPFTIAKQHNMALKRFLLLNHLTRHSKIFPGEQYYVE